MSFWDNAVTWITHHPLEGVCGLCVLAVSAGLFLLPAIHEMIGPDHPRI
jgi:hypothetical protein